MPDSYIQLPIETEPDALAQLAFDTLISRWPDWEPHDGQLDTWMITAIAQMAAELRDVASDVPTSIFKFFGGLVGVTPLTAVAATATATIHVVDAAGYTVPAGSIVAVPDAAGVLQAFQIIDDIVIGSGTTSLAAVPISAVTAGADASGVGGAGVIMELVTMPSFVTSVVMEVASSNGIDDEDPDVYLDRLTAELALQAPRPILAEDFAAFARNTAGVWRAAAIDGYDAVAATFNNARTVTVALMGSDGNPVSSGVKSATLSALQAQREANFLVYTIDPTYTTIDVQFTVTAFPNVDKTELNANIVQAINDFLNPLNWGAPETSSRSWSQSTTVRINDLIGVVYRVSGVKDVTSVTQRTGAGSYAASDIALTGAAPATRPGAISGTVN